MRHDVNAFARFIWGLASPPMLLSLSGRLMRRSFQGAKVVCAQTGAREGKLNFEGLDGTCEGTWDAIAGALTAFVELSGGAHVRTTVVSGARRGPLRNGRHLGLTAPKRMLRSAPVNVTVKHSMFEGLYDRVLQPSGRFAEQLREAGYDPSTPRTEYPVEIWLNCMFLSAKTERAERAVWLLGRRFIEGYLETIIGRLISASFPFLSAASFVKKVPRFVSSGISTPTVVQWKAPNHAHITFEGAKWISGPLMGGVVEVSFERIGVKGAELIANDTTADLAWLELR